MRHGKKFNHLGRTAPHRKAMLSNMASSLILNKRISTTVAKAKALRKYVEPLLTKSKTDSTHSRRVVFSYLQDKESVKILFDEISEKISDRPGGYTRIIKTGNRLGDNADMCIMELVDYNDLLLAEKEPAKAKTRRSRRGKKAKDADVAPAVEAQVEEPVAVEEAEEVTAEVEVAETAEVATEEVAEAEVVEETTEAPAEEAVVEEPKDEVVEEVKAEEEAAEPEASAEEETKEDESSESKDDEESKKE